MANRDSYYITTPIYYVNGAPHIGHAYTTTAADTAARWQRMKGKQVRFLTGTDEHGQKVLEAAETRGMTAKAHCDDMVLRWQQMMERLNISYDRFIRTTDADHEELVSAMLRTLFERGEIYDAEYEGWYLVKDEVFVTEKEREERLESGELVEADFRHFKERNYFFRMSKYAQPLIDYIEENPEWILPTNRRNEVLGFLKKGLGDLCISRPKERMSWGIELPFDEDFVTYVWFDALLNYVTGSGHKFGEDISKNTWWPADYHLIGKDILTTHSVYWTTMLMAMGLPQPRHIYAHGWWLSADGAKMSKSVGNVIDVELLCEAFGVDATRYFFMREIRFGADGGFSYDQFMTRYNADLANDLGNLLHRGLSMTGKWLGGVVPAREAPNEALLAQAREVVATFDRELEGLQFNKALEAVFSLVGAANKYIDTMEPWRLNREGRTGELAAVMRDVLEVCHMAGALLLPVMPTKGAELLAKFGRTAAQGRGLVQAMLRGEHVLDGLTTGEVVTAGDPLFPRHRELPAQIAALFAAPEPEGPAPLPDLDWIEFGDFSKVQLRVGEVVAAEVHPKADKLLVLQVEVGEARPRTICAGVKSKFTPEDLVGRKVVVVVNLKPRKLRGVASEGMVLAAGDKAVIDLLSVDAPAGEVVR